MLSYRILIENTPFDLSSAFVQGYDDLGGLERNIQSLHVHAPVRGCSNQCSIIRYGANGPGD